MSAFWKIISIAVCLTLEPIQAHSPLTDLDESRVCGPEKCYYGDCVNGNCLCREGWQGSQCQHCAGKIRLSAPAGTISSGIGNYTNYARCSWLIESNPNSKVRLHIEEFATEHGWDYLYIFDGDSVESPLLAAFSGLAHTHTEVVTSSNRALVHFSSDAYYNEGGFKISYRPDSCPTRDSNHECSGHGKCKDRLCTCDSQWKGEACDVQSCPKNCTYEKSHGTCDLATSQCRCFDGFQGEDCSQQQNQESWDLIAPLNDFLENPKALAGHCGYIWEDIYYTLGGVSFGDQNFVNVHNFSMQKNVLYPIYPYGDEQPLPRYGHSCINIESKIYMYGGTIINSTESNEIWTYDVIDKQNFIISWRKIDVPKNCYYNSTLCGPLHVSGHTANLVNGPNNEKKMVVIFGYSTLYGYLNIVQEYDVKTGEWQIVNTTGHSVKGTAYHTSVYDHSSNLIYVYGGYYSETKLNQAFVNRLYAYHTIKREWRLLAPAPSARYLHSAVFVSDGLMLVFGGKATYTDKRYSLDTIVYDVVCDNWQQYTMPETIDSARYGHSAFVYNDSMYIYSGFNGQMIPNILSFTPGSCHQFINHNQCLEAKVGLKCIWDVNKESCIPLREIANGSLSNANSYNYEYMKCLPSSDEITFKRNICQLLTDCAACVNTSDKCIWCGTSCSYKNCNNSINDLSLQNFTSFEMCDINIRECYDINNCQACRSNRNCIWTIYEGFTSCKPLSHDKMVNGINNEYAIMNTCESPSANYTSCGDCTELGEGIWCQNQQKCIDSRAFLVSFPYGQCRDWTSRKQKCLTIDNEKEWCSDYKNCSNCRADPSCGWCDDGSQTGRGKCLHGGAHEPSSRSSKTCPLSNWYFTECPACQCNGHSTCYPNSNECIQPCKGLSQGLHCETCKPGYFGNPSNGETCKPCFCNGQGEQCDNQSGKCLCQTKGIIGDHCEKCDENGNYHGNPLNETCFYNLTTNYQFTFNMSRKDYRQYSAINFKNSPPNPFGTTNLHIKCSNNTKMNITIKKTNGLEEPFLLNADCTNLGYNHQLIDDNDSSNSQDKNLKKTFYVYLYNHLRLPSLIQIFFSQNII